jgi:hypothetical protein
MKNRVKPYIFRAQAKWRDKKWNKNKEKILSRIEVNRKNKRRQEIQKNQKTKGYRFKS